MFKKAEEILLRDELVVTAEYLYLVIRLLFCNTHCKATLFNQYFELIQKYWKGDGNFEEKELLDAIRLAHKFSVSADSTPAVDAPSSPQPLARNSFVFKSAARATPSPLTIQSTPVSTGAEQFSESTQSLPKLSLRPVFSLELRPRRLLAPTVQKQHIRSRSDPPQTSNVLKCPQGFVDRPSHDSIQRNSLHGTPSHIRTDPL
jgi:hypothetical protein